MTRIIRHGGESPRRSPSLLIVGRLGASALALISSPIVARALGPNGRGETAAALALFLIVPVVLNMGMPLEVRRQAATSDGFAVMRTARILVTSTFVLSCGIATLTYCTIFAQLSSDARLVAAIGIALTPLSASWALDISILVAHRRYGGVFVIQVLQPAVYLTLILLFWALNKTTVATVIAANIAGTLAAFFVGLAIVRVPIRGPREAAGKLLRRGMTFFGSAIAEAASSKADQVIVLPLIGAYQAGLYSVAATIGAVPMAIGHALGASYFTPIAQAHDLRRAHLQSESIRTAIAASVMAVPPIALVAWVTIPWIFGEEFYPSIPATMVALVGSAAMLSAFVASMALAADGRGLNMTIAQVASFLLAIVSLLALGPTYGAVGAAIASSLGYFALLTVLLAFLRLPLKSLIPSPNDFSLAVRRLRRDK